MIKLPRCGLPNSGVERKSMILIGVDGHWKARGDKRAAVVESPGNKAFARL
jgi:hypothetical protein